MIKLFFIKEIEDSEKEDDITYEFHVMPHLDKKILQKISNTIINSNSSIVLYDNTEEYICLLNNQQCVCINVKNKEINLNDCYNISLSSIKKLVDNYYGFPIKIIHLQNIFYNQNKERIIFPGLDIKFSISLDGPTINMDVNIQNQLTLKRTNIIKRILYIKNIKSYLTEFTKEIFKNLEYIELLDVYKYQEFIQLFANESGFVFPDIINDNNWKKIAEFIKLCNPNKLPEFIKLYYSENNFNNNEKYIKIKKDLNFVFNNKENQQIPYKYKIKIGPIVISKSNNSTKYSPVIVFTIYKKTMVISETNYGYIGAILALLNLEQKFYDKIREARLLYS